MNQCLALEKQNLARKEQNLALEKELLILKIKENQKILPTQQGADDGTHLVIVGLVSPGFDTTISKNSILRQYPILMSLVKLAVLLETGVPPLNELEHEIRQNSGHDAQIWVIRHIIRNLITRDINTLVLDEGQVDIDLIDALVKNNPSEFDFHLVVSGTPVCGERSIDFTKSCMARGFSVTVDPFNGFEVLALLRNIFGAPVSAACLLDFWTLFVGEPYLYTELLKKYAERLTSAQKSAIAEFGILHSSTRTFDWCAETRTAYSVTGEIPVSTIQKLAHGSKQITSQDSKPINQLVSRKIVAMVQKSSDFLCSGEESKCTVYQVLDFYVFSENRLCRFLNDKGKARNAFQTHRGFAFENLVSDIFNYHISAQNIDWIESHLGYRGHRLDTILLDYGNETDADLLLVERPPSDMSLDTRQKAYIFNMKSNPIELSGAQGYKSRQKFISLLDKFAVNYDVILCLAVEKITDETRDEIILTWKDFKYRMAPVIFDLSTELNFESSVKITCDSSTIFVQRTSDVDRIINVANNYPNTFIHGRFRVGKTSILKHICHTRQDWKYIELPKPSQ
jgi:hypothetical protein